MQMLRGDLYDPWFEGEHWGIRILSGSFKDVVIKVNSVEFSKTQDSSVDVDYATLSTPESVTDEDLKSELFNQVMSTIINDVLREAIKIDQDEQNRTNDSSQSGSQ